MRRWAVAGLLVGILLVLVVQQGEPATGDMLGKITELAIVIETLPPAAREEGMTQDQLQAELTVQLKAKIPRLKIVKTPSSGDWLYLHVHLTHVKTEGGRKTAYYGSVRLALLRDVTILATGTFASAFIWESEFALWGPLGWAWSLVKERMGDLVTEFAAEYYKAGNP